jgi:hypothetical protein
MMQKTLLGLKFSGTVLVFATPTLAHATCISRADFADGVMIEYQAPKGIIYNSAIRLDDARQLKTGYSSIRPNSKKLIVEYHRGFFELSSWSASLPSRKTRHTYEPAVEELLPENVGDVIKFKHSWISASGFKTDRNTVMNVVGKRQQTVSNGTYDVLEIISNSKTKLSNGTIATMSSRFAYVAELNFKDGALFFRSPENLTIRKLNSDDYIPKLPN